MRLLCYLCPEALFQSVPFLRELAPPCTFCEWRSRDGEIPVKADGIWSTGPLGALWRSLGDGCQDRYYGDHRSTFAFLWRPPLRLSHVRLNEQYCALLLHKRATGKREQLAKPFHL